MSERIVVLVPTEPEAGELRGDFVVEFCGVGMAEAAAATHRAIACHAPDLLILAGIAGAYPGSGLAVGDAVLVSSERMADLGTMRDGRFTPLYNREYRCPHATPDFGLPLVASNTVSTGATPVASPADIENMEGSAFFAVCLAAGVRFLELRTISNFVGDERDKWNIPLAVNKLSISLSTLHAQLSIE